MSQLCHARASGTVNTGESAATRLSLHQRVVYVLQPSLRLSNGPVRRVPGALHENQVHDAITSNCYVRLENWRPLSRKPLIATATARRRCLPGGA